MAFVTGLLLIDAPASALNNLGSVGFPHLKLQVTNHQRGGEVCVFSVDTHDAFPRVGNIPAAEHPDYAAWTQLQKANGTKKTKAA